GRGRSRGVKRRLASENYSAAPDFDGIDSGGGGGVDDKDNDWVPSGSAMWEVEPSRSRSGRMINRIRTSPMEMAAAPACTPSSPEERTSVLGRHLPKGNKWRKYGEKVIEGLRRSYFRCSVPGCPARLRAEWRPWASGSGSGGGGMTAGEAKQALWISLDGGDHEHSPKLPMSERRKKADGVTEWTMVQPDGVGGGEDMPPLPLPLPLPLTAAARDPNNDQGQDQHPVQTDIPIDHSYHPPKSYEPKLTALTGRVQQQADTTAELLPPPLPQQQQQWRQREEWGLREKELEGRGRPGDENGAGLAGSGGPGDAACGVGDKKMCFVGRPMGHPAEPTVAFEEYVYGGGGLEHHGLHEPMLYGDVGEAVLYDNDAASEDVMYAHWEVDLDETVQTYGGVVVATGMVGGPAGEGMMMMPVTTAAVTAAPGGGALEAAAVGPCDGAPGAPPELPSAGLPRVMVAESSNLRHPGAIPPARGGPNGGGEAGVGAGRGARGGGEGGGGGGCGGPTGGSNWTYAGIHHEQPGTLGTILGPMGWSWDMDTGELPPLSLPLPSPWLAPPPPPQSLALPRSLLSPPSLELPLSFMQYPNGDVQSEDDLITSEGHVPVHFMRGHGAWFDRTAGSAVGTGFGGMSRLGRGSEGGCWSLGEF
ncbi:hypothetical protein Vretifemale_14323, partial [Volvox reticuliferus]